jgi:hypothetical protein
MTVFAKKTMHLSEWTKIQDQVEMMQERMSAPHDLIMFSAKTDDVNQDEIYIGLPDITLLSQFPGFQQIDRASLPDHLIALVVREDGFAERFPDIARKRRS